MKHKAYLAIILAGLLAGTTGIIIKNIGMDAKAITFVRMVIPAFILGVGMKWNASLWTKGNIRLMLVASFLNAIRMYLYIFAFVYTSIGNAAILFYTWPIFTTIMGIYFLKERVNVFQASVILLAFAGLVISYADRSFSWQDRDMLGMLAALGASIFYAITVIIFKSEIQAYSKKEVIFFQNIAGAILFFPAFITSVPTITTADLLWSSAYGFFIGIFIFYLFFYSLTYLQAYVVSAFMYLEVVGAVFLGFLILGEQLTWTMMFGGSLIVTSSFLLNQRK